MPEPVVESGSDNKKPPEGGLNIPMLMIIIREYDSFPLPGIRARSHSLGWAKRAAKLTGWALSINKLLRISQVVLVCAGVGLLMLAPPVCGGTAEAAKISWQPWAAQTFANARRDNKPIFIDVGIEGCTACRRMDEVTFTHPEVIRRLNEHFVSISVDAEARPDIGDRYGDWAWPALIFLGPDTTQVLALRGNRVPRNFIPILDELVAKHAAGKLDADGLAPLAAPAQPLRTALDPLRRQVRAQLDGQLNEVMGSWRKNGIGSAAGGRQQHLLMRAHMFGNASLQAVGVKTADSYLNLLDPVWGGVYQAYFEREKGLGTVIPEKRILGQANAMLVFASAYQLTGDVRYRNGMRKVDDYLRNWMASAVGTFYTSQEYCAEARRTGRRSSLLGVQNRARTTPVWHPGN